MRRKLPASSAVAGGSERSANKAARTEHLPLAGPELPSRSTGPAGILLFRPYPRFTASPHSIHPANLGV